MCASSSGLRVSRGPIFGLVARLVHQKGIDLVLSAADEIIEAGGQIVVTGSGEPAIEAGAGARRIAAGRTRSGSRSDSTTARHGGFLPAAISR